MFAPPSDFRAVGWSRIDEAERQAKPRSRFTFAWPNLWSRPALGWATAAVAVVALAPFVVPGGFSSAGLGSFIHPGVGRTWTVRAQAPRAAGSDVVVPLTVEAVGSVPARVRVLSGPAAVPGGAAEVLLTSQTPAEVVLKVDGNGMGQSVTLEVSWQQDGQPRSRTVTVALPR